MEIRFALEEDYGYIAQLHSDSITEGFISKLGSNFLTLLYSTIGKQKGSCVIVAQVDGKIIGFISGTINIKELYKKTIVGNWYHLIIPILKFILFPKTLRLIMETTLYGFRRKEIEYSTSYNAELLSISINELFRNQGIGKKLVNEFELFLKKTGIGLYKVVTSADDQKSNCFYRSTNFTLNRQFIHHGNKMNEYVKRI